MNEKKFFVIVTSNFGITLPSGLPKNHVVGVVSQTCLEQWGENKTKLLIYNPKCMVEVPKMSPNGKSVEDINIMLLPMYLMKSLQQEVIIEALAVEVLGEVIPDAVDSDMYQFTNLDDRFDTDHVRNLLKNYNHSILEWLKQFSKIIRPEVNSVVDPNNKYKIVL